jgi:hypothetical protein
MPTQEGDKIRTHDKNWVLFACWHREEKFWKVMATLQNK